MNEDPAIRLVNILKARLDELGLDARHASRLIGLPRENTLNRILQYKDTLSPMHVEGVADGLGLDFFELLGLSLQVSDYVPDSVAERITRGNFSSAECKWVASIRGCTSGSVKPPTKFQKQELKALLSDRG